MINAHGGKLVNRVKDVDPSGLISIDISADLANDVENIADGIFSPLEGFLNQQDFESVISKGRLANGTAWTIPTVLDVDSRDRHLTHQMGHLGDRDVGRAADVLAGIDISIDEALSERERIVASDELRLRHLELMMENLLQRTEHADMDELISITDELRFIQHELGLVSEDSMEAFEAEDEELKVARLSTIKPTTRLMGAEE